MKNNRRDWRLDAFIGRWVTVEFRDGTTKEGVLDFEGKSVCLDKWGGAYTIGYMQFRKSQVKRIKGDGKWVNLSNYKKQA